MSFTTGSTSRRSVLGDNVDTILCLFCQASIHYVGLPAHRYTEHLFKEHNILFDIDAVVNRTLSLQQPGYARSSSSATSSSPRITKDGASQTEAAAAVSEHQQQSKPEVASTAADSDVEQQKISNALPAIKKKISTITLPWYSGCEYQCQVCKITFYYVEQLRKHVKKSHGLTVDDYVDQYRQFETKVVHCHCKICKAQIKKNFAAIVSHLTNEHPGITLDKYEAKFKLKNYELLVLEDVTDSKKLDSSQLEKGEGETLKSKSETIDNNPRVKIKEIMPENQDCGATESAKPAAAVTADRLYSETSSSFECKVCPQCPARFSQNDQLLSHLKMEHKQKLPPTTPVVSVDEESYECQICSRNIKHTKAAIVSHLQSAHNTTLESYEEVFHPRNKSPIIIPKLLLRKKEESEDDDDDPKFSSYEEFRAGSCQFECKKCDFTATSSTKFWSHANSEHSLSLPAYKETCGDPCVKQKKIECLACHKVIRHEPGALTQHAGKVHGLKLEDFYAKYYKAAAGNEKESGDSTDLWANQCEYRCAICSFLSKSSAAACGHAKVTHGLEAKAYKKKYGTFLTKLAKLTCQICQKEMVHEAAGLRVHMKKAHHLTLDTYFKMYVKENSSSTTTIPSSPSENQEPSISQQPSKESDMIRQQLQQPVLNVKAGFRKWKKERCTYECKICSKTFGTYKDATSHIKSAHRLSAKDYVQNHGTLLSKEVLHRCEICFSRIQWSYMGLFQHYSKKHGISVKEYYKNHIHQKKKTSLVKLNPSGPSLASDNDDDSQLRSEAAKWSEGCTYQCKICSKKFKVGSTANYHVNSKHGINSKQYAKKYGPIMVHVRNHQCQVCKKLQRHRGDCLLPHIISHGLTLTAYYQTYIKKPQEEDQAEPSAAKMRRTEQPVFLWKNQCTYECRKCNFVTKSRPNLRIHIFNQHKMQLSSYTQKYGRLETKVVHHKCRLCGEEILHDRDLLRGHLTTKHDLSILDYFQRHVREADEPLDGGVKVVLPTMQDGHVDVLSSSAQESPLNTNSEEDGWMDGCTYRCGVCSAQFFRRAHIREHVQLSHQLDFETYQTLYGDPTLVMNLFKCDYCSEILTHDTDDISAHVEQHSLSPKEYYERFCRASTSQQPMSLPQQLDLKADFMNLLGEDQEENEEEESRMAVPNNAEWDASDQRRNSTTHFNWNQCSYKCPLCDRVCNTHMAMYSHSATHTGGKPCTDWPEKNIRKHSCRVCQREFKFEKKAIKLHLKSTHQLTLEEYERMFEKQLAEEFVLLAANATFLPPIVLSQFDESQASDPLGLGEAMVKVEEYEVD